jgi:hypothetical protein
MQAQKKPKAATKEKSIPHVPLPFEEVMKDCLKVKATREESPEIQS